jgi:SHS2 domain-containing protein
VEQGAAGFAIFAVTADLGIHAWAPDCVELFRQAARGLWSVMFDPSRVRKERSVVVTISAVDRESLLVAWLNELLFVVETERLAMAGCAITVFTETQLTASVWGETIAPDRHRLGSEIKAVTYNQLAISPTARGWEARVVVDL